MATARPRSGINLRKAKAGRIILENPEISQTQALVQAGYAPSTARLPKERNLGADACVAEAVKADPTIDPSRLLSKARRCLDQKLDEVNGSPAKLEQARLGEVARIVDVVERWYAGHDKGKLESASDTVDRLEQLAAVLQELERRGKITVHSPAQDSPALD